MKTIDRLLSLHFCLSLALLAFIASSASGKDLQGLEETAMKNAVTKVAPSVVRIETFGGLEKVEKTLIGSGPTTGLVVSEDGYIISSAFNFVQKPSSILITLGNGKRAAAKIVARDHSRMLVLLKANFEQKLTPPETVSRDDLAVGQWTIAVGRTYQADAPNISIGVLSAKNRIWGKAVQTDAKISPSNYGGPLIDIYGRVIGVLVPLSPQSSGELAGAEWYDSGIGFATPLEDVFKNLDTLKQGKDLHPGLMGISLQGNDIYSKPAKIAASQPNSPAAKAGLKAGDIIIEIDDYKISRQAQLKHALGPRYAGETIRIALLRDDKRIETSLELIDHLEPYAHPFLGVLPRRDANMPQGEEGQSGFVVRFVYPQSGADKAGVKQGDRIIGLDGHEISSAVELREKIFASDPKLPISLKLQRGDQTLTIRITLGTQPVEIPIALPPAREPLEAGQGDLPDVGVLDIKIPEEKNTCVAYIPEAYHSQISYGIVVWLHAPGGFDREKLLARWKTHCDQHDLILLAPNSSDPNKWLPTEIAFVRKTINHVTSRYNVDPTRVATHGYQAGGAMAFLSAFSFRDLIRGVAAVDATIPGRIGVPANDPVYPLSVYSASTTKVLLDKVIAANVEKLLAKKYPVTVKKLDKQPRYLNEQEIVELIRWLDTLDRI